DVSLEKGEQVALIDVFMPAVRLSQQNRSINRTVTLPAWLNAAALEKGINFSQALQSTLMNELGIAKN
ncbi:MAG: type II toxin-antitoxin system HicB family antitoxin, partial [Oscillospiraceae bacterium]|nr:type II toxin-antitoxin system HicB family antitoxin [Oscillospiraceae bacterium]